MSEVMRKILVVDKVAILRLEPENFDERVGATTFSCYNFTFAVMAKGKEKIEAINKQVNELAKLFRKNIDAFLKKYADENKDTSGDVLLHNLLLSYVSLLIINSKNGKFFSEVVYDNERDYYEIHYTTRNLEEEELCIATDDVYALLGRRN